MQQTNGHQDESARYFAKPELDSSKEMGKERAWSGIQPKREAGDVLLESLGRPESIGALSYILASDGCISGRKVKVNMSHSPHCLAGMIPSWVSGEPSTWITI